MAQTDKNTRDPLSSSGMAGAASDRASTSASGAMGSGAGSTGTGAGSASPGSAARSRSDTMGSAAGSGAMGATASASGAMGSAASATGSSSSGRGSASGSSGGSGGSGQGPVDVKEAVGQVQAQASEMVGLVREQATTQISSQKERAASSLGALAGTLHEASHQARSQDETAMIADYVDMAASQVERLATTLQEQDIEQLLATTERFARKQPALFLAAAFGLGFAAARFLRSSQPGQSTGFTGYRPVSDASTDRFNRPGAYATAGSGYGAIRPEYAEPTAPGPGRSSGGMGEFQANAGGL